MDDQAVAASGVQAMTVTLEDAMVGRLLSWLRDTTIYIAVIFDRPVGNNTVVLTIPTLTGGTEDVPFKQEERCSQLIAAPLTDFGIVIKDAPAAAKGNIVISTSD